MKWIFFWVTALCMVSCLGIAGNKLKTLAVKPPPTAFIQAPSPSPPSGIKAPTEVSSSRSNTVPKISTPPAGVCASKDGTPYDQVKCNANKNKGQGCVWTAGKCHLGCSTNCETCLLGVCTCRVVPGATVEPFGFEFDPEIAQYGDIDDSKTMTRVWKANGCSVVCDAGTWTKDEAKNGAKCSSPCLPQKSTEAPDWCPTEELPEPEIKKVIAIGDLHGDLTILNMMLEKANLVKPGDPLKWLKPDTMLVQTGDLVDRGGQEKDLVIYMSKLALRNPKHVLPMSGNHEAQISRGQFSESKEFCPKRIDKNYKKVKKGKPGWTQLTKSPGAVVGSCLDARQAYAVTSCDGEINQRIRYWPYIRKVGNVLFAHGGVSLKWVQDSPCSKEKKLTGDKLVECINKEGAEEMQAVCKRPDNCKIWNGKNRIMDNDGPLFYRGYGSDHLNPKNTPEERKKICEEVKTVLEMFGCNIHVTAHTTQGTSRIGSFCFPEKPGDAHGVFQIDTRLSYAVHDSKKFDIDNGNTVKPGTSAGGYSYLVLTVEGVDSTNQPPAARAKETARPAGAKEVHSEYAPDLTGFEGDFEGKIPSGTDRGIDDAYANAILARQTDGDTTHSAEEEKVFEELKGVFKLNKADMPFVYKQDEGNRELVCPPKKK